MRATARWVAVGVLVVAGCATPGGGQRTNSGEGGAGGVAGNTVAGMTAAVVEIERALGSERIKELHAGYEKPFQLDPKDPFKRFLWAYSLEDRNDAWQEMTKITKLNDRFYWAYL